MPFTSEGGRPMWAVAQKDPYKVLEHFPSEQEAAAKAAMMGDCYEVVQVTLRGGGFAEEPL